MKTPRQSAEERIYQALHFSEREKQLTISAHHLAMSKNVLCCCGWSKNDIDIFCNALKEKLYYLNGLEV